MPTIKLKVPESLVPWTKTPNVVIDKFMPMLNDSEFRVFMVLLRSTAGWNREGYPVKLTYRMLQARTGRSSEAISRALLSLENQGIIHISRNKARNYMANAKKLISESEVHINKEI